MRSALLVSLMTSLLVPACAETTAPDELAGESEADGQEGKGDTAAAFGFLYVTPDTRACSFDAGPDCGRGFFVSTPNRATMRCGFTVPMSKCKVFDIDWTRTAMPASVANGYEDGLRAGTPLVVRGELIPAPNDAGVHLSVSEIWLASSPAWAEGVFTLVKDNGLRCIKAPCPSMTERKLNSNLAAQISELDLETSGAPEELIDRAYRELYGDGLIVVGYRYYDRDGGKARTANKFFTKAPVPLF
jgi:hypothetical protein